MASAAVLTTGGFLFVGWGLLALASRWLGAWPAIACAALLSPAAAVIGVGTLAPWTDTRSARGLATLLPPGAHVVAFRQFRTSLPFYLRRPVPLYSRTAGELTSNYICANRERLEHDPNLRRPWSIRRLIASGEPFYVVTEPSRLEQLAQALGRPVAPGRGGYAERGAAALGRVWNLRSRRPGERHGQREDGRRPGAPRTGR